MKTNLSKVVIVNYVGKFSRGTCRLALIKQILILLHCVLFCKNTQALFPRNYVDWISSLNMLQFILNSAKMLFLK